ncbi:DUF1156 domain-containing protein [Bacillus sp. NTK071]|uniref:anti-phage-associated DUF1156 domain-containing protein n=1 Tax=Bacillus sp. NTK071 TaxID=2802175 RepID=UPI001A8ED63C|nr:anti-phage-associated DUF1156 domain-containing protein [Bacillus sp. NTK071]MBN8209374.1 DUF1156 domain-containing protein [Bacillus sp. NTK071]
MLDYSKSFIETQFPVSKVSKESYKERKANLGQTLTGLGKWWGRKPLILVRATILGALLPVSDDPKKDRDIFLKSLTMDEDGLLLRKNKSIPLKVLLENVRPRERELYFDTTSTNDKPKYKSGIKQVDKKELQEKVFSRLSYDDKLKYTVRPEHVEEIPDSTWEDINNHLDTSASNLNDLIEQLGRKRFGHIPSIGDAFSGGGSIPFEAARIGANAYGSDLNPVAALLTWASLNISGASEQKLKDLKSFQKDVYEAVDKQVTNWGIEHNEAGHRADSYLYCNESSCPECGYKVPLSPSWIIGKGSKTVALLHDNGNSGFDFEIVQDATKEQIKQSEEMSTVRNGKFFCLHCEMETPISVIRRDRKDAYGNNVSGLRKWEKDEFIPRNSDPFQERLYCIRYTKKVKTDKGKIKVERFYKAPDKNDLEREDKVINLLDERFLNWQENGYLPSIGIESGDKTDEPVRTRGWRFWHQLFNPRQLLVTGLLLKTVDEKSASKEELVIGLLGVNKITDWNSKLCIWNVGAGVETTQNTYTNQALNTLYNYGTRGFIKYEKNWLINLKANFTSHRNVVEVGDARVIEEVNDIWVTDPPYADAVNYHELSEFFLAWDKGLLSKAFPEWYSDSKRVLAVKGTGESFNKSMVEVYTNLRNNMPDNGMQVVMFTHQDVSVWAELAMILWSAGLKVSSAWTIATETESGGLKDGNYVQGTVLLVLRKQTSDDIIFQDELYREIKKEVKSQIDSMQDLDDKDDPNFTDADYLLASYASSLKVLTSYKDIEGVDVEYELTKPKTNERSPIEELIEKAKVVAYDYLIPESIDKLIWRDFSPSERFYIRGLELEMSNVYQIGAYQELAKGFGVTDYQDMFENQRANTVRLKTPSEYKTRGLDRGEFGSSLLRQVLVAVHQSVKAESTEEGKKYLKAKYDNGNEYWNKRSAIMELLNFLSKSEHITHMKYWSEDAYYARLLKESIRHDGI